MALALDGSAHVNFSGTSGSLSLTTTNANDVIIVCVEVNGTTTASVTASGLTFKLRKRQPTPDSPPNYEEVWYAVASSPLSNTTITVTLNASTSYCTVDAFGVSGADTTTIFDPNVSLPAGTPVLLVSTSNANDFIFGYYRLSPQSPTAGSGWTAIAAANYQLVEYQVVTSTQSNLPVTLGSGNPSSLNGYAGIGDAIMAASGSTPALDGSAQVNVTSGTSVSLSLTTANANDVIIVCVEVNGTTTASVTGSGLTFTLRKRIQTTDGNPYYAEVWYAVASSALSNATITITLNASTTYCTVCAFGVSGANTTTIFDSNASLPAQTAGVPVVATNYPNDFIFGACRFYATSSPTAGTGWTQISGADYQLIEYRIVSSTQSNLDVTVGTGSNDIITSVGDAIMAYGVLTTRSGSASKGRAAGIFAAALSGRSAAAGTARGGISVGNLIALVARSGAAAAARAAGTFAAALSGRSASAGTARPAALFAVALAVRSGAAAAARAVSAFTAMLLGRSMTAGSARAAASGRAALSARGTAASTARGSINFGVVALIARSGAAAIAHAASAFGAVLSGRGDAATRASAGASATSALTARTVTMGAARPAMIFTAAMAVRSGAAAIGRAASAFASVLSGRGEAAGTAHGTAAGVTTLSARGAAVGIAHGNLNLGNLIALVARSGTTAMGRAVGAFAAVLSGRSTTVGSAHAAASGAAALSARGNAAGTAHPTALFAVALAVRSGAAAAARAVSAFAAVLLGRSTTAGSARAAASGTTALTARNTLTLTARGQPQAAVPLVVMARSFAVSLLRAILRTPPAYQGAHLINDQMAATTVINDQMRST